jgi:antitoxin component YwqK of YwqJK toxin-antitoxin module
MPKPARLPRLGRVTFYLSTGGDLAAALGDAVADDAGRRPTARVTPAHKAVAAWGRMQADVPNGGFAQFFYNHRGDAGLAPLADLLDELGAPKAAAAVRDATAVYRRHRKAFAVTNPWDGLFGSIPEFDGPERTFMGVVSRANRAVEAWVRSRIGELAADEQGEPIDPAFTGAVEARGADGVVREYLEVKAGRPHGAYREFFEDGTVRQARFYKSGKVSGDFWPSGQPMRKQAQRGGLTVVEWFYPSGRLHKRYVRDKDGYVAEPVRLYHENGQLAEELAVAGTEPRGPWLKFFDDGAPRLEAVHDAEGQPVVRNAWDDGRRQVVKNGTGTFREDGRSINWGYDVYIEHSFTTEAELKGGRKHGRVTTFYDGRLWGVSAYRDGVRDGEATTYWDNGRVRSVTAYARGKPGKERSYPKFDRPVPAVVLAAEADERLYAAWGHVPVDEYPRPLNLDAVRADLRVPGFLREVYERNLAGAPRGDYEVWNTFKDGIAYLLTVDEAGAVTSAVANGSGVYSGGEWGTYPPLLARLRFAPGRIRGRAVGCRVLATVDHTFVEGSGPAE